VGLGEEAAAGRCLWSPQAVIDISGGRPADIAIRTPPGIARLIAPLAFVMLAVAIICTALGFAIARQTDNHHELADRQALRAALEALRAVSPDFSRADPLLIRIVESASGLKELRFDADPPGEGREVQSVTDVNGRIIGWFSWNGQRPATATMHRLLPLAGVITLGLFGFAVVAMRQLRRLGSMLADNARAVHKIANEDPITGLPNLRRLRDTLDRSLAERNPREMLAFALIDLGGFDDMKETVGESGEDELLVEIAGRLRNVVPKQAMIARLRGDRFGVAIPVGDERAALAVAETGRGARGRSGSIRWSRSAPMSALYWLRGTAPRGRT
jgi:GGDEF domain-containing protein